MTSAVTNIFTVDVEDWPQSTVDRALPISDRARSNTLRLLDMLAAADVRATFFVLGLVAGKFPDLLRRIAAAGHELASHGVRHDPVRDMTPEAFRQDLRASIRLIEDAAGVRVLGYRAPDFSISPESFWAFEVMAEEGLAYDSSIYPFAGRRYGVAAAFAEPWRIRCAANPSFLELPLTTWTAFGRRVPAAGGGYFRLFPYLVTRMAIRRLNRAGAPATSYFHPYELDRLEMRQSGVAVPWRLRLEQGLGRGRVPAKLSRLLRDFSWGPARAWLDNVPALTAARALDLDGFPARPARWISGSTAS